ncbi:MAG: sugar transferase, partial [Acidobacteriota bacterium]
MLKQKARAIAVGVLLAELALVALALPLAYALRHGVLARFLPTMFPVAPAFERYVILVFLVVPIFAPMLHAVGFRRSHRTLPLGEEIWAAAKVAFGGTALLTLFVYGLRFEFVSRWFLAVFGVVTFLLLAAERVALRLISRWVRARGYNFRTVILVGTGPKATQLADFMEAHPHWGFRVAGYLDDENGGQIRRSNRWPCLGKIGDLETLLGREVVDEVIFVIENGKLGDYEHALLVAERHGVRAHVSLDIFPHVLARPVLEELDGIPLLTFTTTPSNPMQLVVKRAIDLALSLVLFLLTLPITALAALAIRLSSPGPIFFRQVRCGLNGRLFTLLKFRTMEAKAETRLLEIAHLNEMSGPVFKSARDPRLTPIGQFLRRLSIDELPQLWNVIVGDM